MWGDHYLGNNFDLIEGDRIEDRVIVYCTGRSAGACTGGTPIIPSNNDTLSLYVEKAKSDKKWIVAKTKNKDQSESYWIFDKDLNVNLDTCDLAEFNSVIQSHITGPLDSTEFESKRKMLNMSLDFK